MTCGQYTESAIGRTMVVTSSTRPTGASRYVGQRIYETDTSRELTYDGTGWIIMSEPSQSWTPASYSNLTIGNATVAGYSHRSDGHCDIGLKITFGSTTSIGAGSPTYLTLPYEMHTTNPVWDQFSVQLNDVSLGQVFGGLGGFYSSTTLALYAQIISASSSILQNLSSTAPFTWATGDIIYVGGRYRMATRYL